jgi:hypothetical protein
MTAGTDTALRRALEWIAGELRENPGARRLDLIDRASLQFGLSPAQAETLCRQLLAADRAGS